MIRFSWALAGLIVLTGPAGADFTLVGADGAVSTAPFFSLSEKGELQLAGAKTVLNSDHWLSLRQNGVVPPPPPAGDHLQLQGGDRLPLEIEGLELRGDKLSLRCPWLAGGVRTELPFASVVLFWRRVPDSEEDAGIFHRRLLAQQRLRDTVVLRNGDVLEGILVRFSGKQVELKAKGKSATTDLDRVAVLAVSSAGVEAAVKDTQFRAVLTDGTRVTLRTANTEGVSLRGTTMQGAAFSAPVSHVVSLESLRARTLCLADEKPAKYEHTPYLSVSWPLVAHANALGGDLRVGGGWYERGLGMHSGSRVVFKLPADAKRFETLVGLDDVAGKRGNVRLRVLLDGKEQMLGWNGDLSGREMPRTIRLPVQGARDLTLVVEPGGRGDAGDNVNWIDPVVIR